MYVDISANPWLEKGGACPRNMGQTMPFNKNRVFRTKPGLSARVRQTQALQEKTYKFIGWRFAR